MDELLYSAEIRDLTKEVLRRKNDIALNMLQIGDMMIRAKEILNHGDFGVWLNEYVSFSDRTARNFMRASRAFPEQKRKSLSDLSSTQVLLLAELPEESREDFVEKSNIQNMSTRELREAVKREKDNADIRSHFARDIDECLQRFDIDPRKLKRFPWYDDYKESFFEPYKGAKYIDFLTAMEKKKITSSIFITKDNIVIDGWQQVQGAIALGWDNITVRYMLCPDDYIADSFDETLKAVFFYWQSWQYTRTSMFDFYQSMLYYTIGDIEKANNYKNKFINEGEEKDRKYIEFMQACDVLLEVWKPLGDAVKFKDAVNLAIPKLHEKNIPVPEYWVND